MTPLAMFLSQPGMLLVPMNLLIIPEFSNSAASSQRVSTMNSTPRLGSARTAHSPSSRVGEFRCDFKYDFLQYINVTKPALCGSLGKR
jgi:hypothetical protein